MSPEISELIETFSKLPGLGPRSAKKMVIELLSNYPSLIDTLGRKLTEIKHKIIQCEECFNIDTFSPCSICTNPSRNKKQICIVEKVSDMWAFENTKAYYGLYHILGGTLSPIDNKGPEEIHLPKLLEHIQTNDVEEKFNYALQILRFASGNTRAFNLVHNPNLFSAIENFGINSEQQEALGVLPDDISAEEKFIAEITDGLIQNATIDESMVMLMHSLSVAKSVELIFMIDVFVKSVDSEKTNQTSKSDLNDHYNTSIIKIVEQELDTLIQMYGQIWNDYFNAENFGFYLSQVLRLEEANIPE